MSLRQKHKIGNVIYHEYSDGIDVVKIIDIRHTKLKLLQISKYGSGQEFPGNRYWDDIEVYDDYIIISEKELNQLKAKLL